MKLVHLDNTTYVSSPGFVMSDKKPWTVPAKQSMYWPSMLARPDLGLNDLPTWLKIPTRVAEQDAELRATKDLPDVAGARHEYRVICGTAGVACPPPFLTLFDQYFTAFTSVRASAWYDDDGLLHRLDVSGTAGWYPDPDAIDMGLEHAPYGDYEFKASFVLDQFGTPVQVTAPPADQITKAFLVTLKH